MNRKCWFKKNLAYDVKCDLNDDSCFVKTECKPDEFCSAIGVLDKETNLTKIIFANCFNAQDTCNGTNQCIATTRNPDDHYFCCCTNDFCNRNLILINLPPLISSQSNSSLDTKWIVAIVLSTITSVILILALLYFIFGKNSLNKLRTSKKFNSHEQPPILVVGTDELKHETQALLELSPKFDASMVKLEEKISQSHLSTVWKGKFKDSDVAVKIYPQNEKQAWQNEKEIYSLMGTSCEFILNFITTHLNTQNTLAKEYWLLTEYQTNGCLYNYLKRNLISWHQICTFSVSMLNGLAYLHAEVAGSKPSIAHRDVKSKNVLVKANGTCCIADFGLAYALKSTKLNDLDIRSQVGTRRYMPPELLEGAISFTKETLMRIDVYSCALVLWELLTRGNFYDQTQSSEYKLPYEKELGLNPSIDEMQEYVVHKNKRPTIEKEWLNYHEIPQLVKTIEECWDVDVEARLSSECAANRLRKLAFIKPIDT